MVGCVSEEIASFFVRNADTKAIGLVVHLRGIFLKIIGSDWSVAIETSDR